MQTLICARRTLGGWAFAAACWLALAPAAAGAARTGVSVNIGLCLREPGVRWATAELLPVRVASGVPDWRPADAFVRSAQKRGLKLILRPFVTGEGAEDAAGISRVFAAAAARYNGDGRGDMPGLLYPVSAWIVDGALHPAAAGADDPAAGAAFAAAVLRALRTADARTAIILAGGVCEPLAGAKPAANAGYQEQFIARLGIELGGEPARWGQAAVGFELAADAGTYARLSALSAFWRGELDASRLGGFGLWILNVSLPRAGEPEQAADLLKLHLCGIASGLDQIFFWTPLAADAFDRQLDAELASAWRARHGVFAAESFRQASNLLANTEREQTRLVQDGAQWRVVFSDPDRMVTALWNEDAAAAGQPAMREVDAGVPAGRATLHRVTATAAWVTEFVEIQNGRLSLPDSRYPTFIEQGGANGDCPCRHPKSGEPRAASGSGVSSPSGNPGQK